MYEAILRVFEPSSMTSRQHMECSKYMPIEVWWRSMSQVRSSRQSVSQSVNLFIPLYLKLGQASLETYSPIPARIYLANQENIK